MNKLFDQVAKGIGCNYCHALEVSHTSELEGIVESTIAEYPDYNEQDYIQFFTTMDVYYLGENDVEEQKIYDFSFREYIEGTI